MCLTANAFLNGYDALGGGGGGGGGGGHLLIKGIRECAAQQSLVFRVRTGYRFGLGRFDSWTGYHF